MTVRFLLDTNVLSEPAKPRPDPRVLRNIEEHRGEFATAAPVWHELLFGCRRLPASRRRRNLEEYLFGVLRPALVVLPYDAAAAEWHAKERARLESRGIRPPFVGGQIAAIASVSRLVLVTSNGADFAGFEGLRVVDWCE